MENILLIGGSGFLMKNLQELYPNYNYIAPRSTQVNWVTNQGVDELPVVDVVIHSAAVYGGLVYNQNYSERILLDNTRMNANVFDYILSKKPKKVITIGSGCSYPGTSAGLLSEDQIGTGRMHSSVELYGMSKLWVLAASEKLLDNWDHLVLANMYGKYDHTDVQKSHLVGALLTKFLIAKHKETDVQLIGTGIAQRDLIYVNDVCDVINHCITRPGSNRAVNVGTGTGTSVKELAQLISEMIYFQGKILWGDEKDNGALCKVLDTARMQQSFPDIHTTQLNVGLRATLSWFQQTLSDHHIL
tara:strand:- start:6444 stop:7349 length:906 start_codon:yes stop_codon:yes gene_type:complete